VVERPAVPAHPRRAPRAVLARETRGQLLRYCAVALVAQGANLALFAGLVAGGVEYHAAGVAGFLAAFTLNFVLNRAWTFSARGAPVRGQLARFTAINAVAFAVSLAALHVLVQVADVPKVIAQALAIGAGMPPNFAGQKLWGFRAR
jgi:putative flippase GtrA